MDDLLKRRRRFCNEIYEESLRKEERRKRRRPKQYEMFSDLPWEENYVEKTQVK